MRKIFLILGFVFMFLVFVGLESEEVKALNVDEYYNCQGNANCLAKASILLRKVDGDKIQSRCDAAVRTGLTCESRTYGIEKRTLPSCTPEYPKQSDGLWCPFNSDWTQIFSTYKDDIGVDFYYKIRNGLPYYSMINTDGKYPLDCYIPCKDRSEENSDGCTAAGGTWLGNTNKCCGGAFSTKTKTTNLVTFSVDEGCCYKGSAKSSGQTGLPNGDTRFLCYNGVWYAPDGQSDGPWSFSLETINCGIIFPQPASILPAGFYLKDITWKSYNSCSHYTDCGTDPFASTLECTLPGRTETRAIISGSTCQKQTKTCSSSCTWGSWTNTATGTVNCNDYSDTTGADGVITQSAPTDASCTTSCSGSGCCSSTTYTCDASKSCTTQIVNGVNYKCHYSNTEKWVWDISTSVPAETACSDGKDNDCDTLIDYKADNTGDPNCNCQSFSGYGLNTNCPTDSCVKYPECRSISFWICSSYYTYCCPINTYWDTATKACKPKGTEGDSCTSNTQCSSSYNCVNLGPGDNRCYKCDPTNNQCLGCRYTSTCTGDCYWNSASAKCCLEGTYWKSTTKTCEQASGDLSACPRSPYT